MVPGAYPEDDLQRDLSDARRLLPGSPFREVLGWIHEDVRPRNYLEIGVNEGASLRSALPATRIIGVDPHPMVSSDSSSDVHIFGMTSDEFFRNHDPLKILEADAIDLSFIDGLHLVEQVIRDFLNLERFQKPRSFVLFHDCIPLSERSAARTRQTSFYSGDAWKFLVFLRRHRPHLQVDIIPTMPTGIGVLSGFSRSHPDGANQLSESDIAAIVALDWPYFCEHRAEFAYTIPNDRDAVRAFFATRLAELTRAASDSGIQDC